MENSNSLKIRLEMLRIKTEINFLKLRLLLEDS